jgi:hypothetical protein
VATPPVPPQVNGPFGQPSQFAAQSGASAAARQGNRIRTPVLIIAAFVVLIVGVAIGLASNASTSQQLTKVRGQLASAHASIDAAHGTISKLRAQLVVAQNNASTAEASAAAKYKADEAKVASTLRRLQTIEGKITATRISADGVYVVGRDIKPGTYHTAGDGQTGGASCYYALLNSTNTSDISDNNNFDGPETVSVTHGAFQISGPCVWYRTG